MPQHMSSLIHSLTLLCAVSLFTVKANAEADALPWANANPYAQAAASAYADAFAEAQAIGHADPEAYALAASDDDCATIGCHAACGMMIIEGQKCSDNNGYTGPYDLTCLCSDNSPFLQRYPSCMECGWTLWKYYSGYVVEALKACSTLSTEPTGTLRCSTTLTDEYTIDTNIQGCEYLGNCPETTSSVVVESSSAHDSSAQESPLQTSISTSASTSASTSTTSTSSTSTSTTSTSTTTSSTTEYSATTYTVTTDLSLSYSFSPGGMSSDCYTTTQHFPVATNNPIDMTFYSWIEVGYYNGQSNSVTNTWFVYNFTDDQVDVTDIEFITSVQGTTRKIQPDSEIWVNTQQGVIGRISTKTTTPGSSSGLLRITANGTRYIYAYSCKSDRSIQILNVLVNFTSDDWDYCLENENWGVYYEPWCTHVTEPNDRLWELRPNREALPESSSELLESSSDSVSEQSSSDITDSSSSYSSSGIADSSSTISEESSIPSFSDSSAAVSDSSSVGSSASSSGPASSSSDVPSESHDSSLSTSSTSISSESSSSSATPTEPSLNGALNDNGLPQWSLTVPGSLGPWTELTFNSSKIGPINFTNAELLVNGEAPSPGATVEITSESVFIVFEIAVEITDVVTITFGGEFTGAGSVTARGILSITTPDEVAPARLAKRATQTWEFESTIESAESSSESGSASSSVLESSGSESGSESGSASSSVSESSGSGSFSASSSITEPSGSGLVSSSGDHSAGITSTATESAASTTVITITSCEENKCHETPVTTGVTVVTTTIDGTVTEYTTYCPISTDTKTETKAIHSDKTTVVTITSCDEDKCVYKTATTTIKSTGSSISTSDSTKMNTVTTGQETKKTTTTTKVTEITSTKTGAGAGTITGTATVSSTQSITASIQTTFTGAGQKLAIGTSILAVIFSILFI